MTEGNFPVWQHLFESPIGWIGLYLDQGLVWTLAMGCVDPKRCQSHLVKESKHLKVDVFEADLPGKVTGATNTYLHDIQPDGALHARTLRQPGPRAILDALDEDAVRRAREHARRRRRPAGASALIVRAALGALVLL